MSNRVFVSGNEAVAIGVKLAKPNVIAAYPITPQTIVVERLAEMVERQELNAEYMYVESEHSALSAVMGASVLGARTFTATSSQGLLYMAEVMHYASGGRVPLVMMNANRSLALPWSIFGDQRDSLSMLDSGWIQVYVEDAQESLDMIIQSYALAEHKDVLTPVMVNLDGFVLTHTYEAIEVPEEEQVDEFLPVFELEGKMDLENPRNLFFSSSPADNIRFKVQQHRAMENSREIIEILDKQYGKITGRSYGGLATGYKTEDADILLITLGSITGQVRDAVDVLRAGGEKVGVVKIRFMRPFPEKEILKLCSNAAVIGVLEKDISFGYHGTVYTNVADALKNTNKKLINFVGGLGGKNISQQDIEDIFNRLKNIDKDTNTVNFVGLEV
ncbi:transketolase C-terminal domain-containing protein [Clostridium sp. BNL1100]|uniref:transketolase C-terminal domain-containing protein n=1 Tax=Clostridium sp. BNL1100 TaxID=755731 RepID=UPI00024A720B|nr:transketolase C-terminal domain-containing protein [Clostridium sp. BNL1100]AEY68135.1 2-oxoacid:ferredoxin oxidoreductase, alpha subunit [Clostridium sp. BNL1100]